MGSARTFSTEQLLIGNSLSVLLRAGIFMQYISLTPPQCTPQQSLVSSMAGSDPWEAAVGTSLSVVSHQNILYIISAELGRQSAGSMLCR